MLPLVIHNPHRTDMKIMIEPGQINISVPPGDAVTVQVHDMPDDATMEIAPNDGPGLTLVIPTSQFTIRHGKDPARAA